MKIIVEKPADNREVILNVIGVNPNNSEYGSIMVSQVTTTINETGFMNRQKRVAFIAGKVEELKSFVQEKNLTVGCNFSEKTATDYKLVVEEATTPFYEGQSGKINPRTGESLHTKDGEMIYSRVVLTADPDKQDIRVEHVKTSVSTTQVTENANVLSSVL